jgi:hypothetical protein
MPEYYKLEQKINEVKKFAEHGLSDVKQVGIASLEGYLSVKKGYPVFIAGAPHSGKTEFTFELLVNWSKLYNWKHFVYCGEGGNIEHIYYELLHKYLEKPYSWADNSEKIEAEMFISEHFVICNHDMDFTVDDFYKAVEKAERELQVKFDTTVFDPFNDIKDETDMFGGREDKYLAYALKKVRISSNKHNRIDILVHHIADVKAVTDSSSGKRYMPPAMPNEWAGGRTWWRRAFLMILIYRPSSFLKNENGVPYEENETQVIIQKAKPKGIAKLSARSIFFDWKKNRYYSFDETGQKLYSCETNDYKPNSDSLFEGKGVF